MARLVQLLNENYCACDWDLRADPPALAYWDHLFRWHLDDVLVPLIHEEYPAASDAAIAAFRATYLRLFDSVRPAAEDHQAVNVLRFTELRRAAQLAHGFADPFRGVKDRENNQALELLPELLAELDAAPAPQRRELLSRGLMAGNLFDLGSRATIQRYRDGQMAFAACRAALPARPWPHGEAEAWWARCDVERATPPYRHAAFFVDNAGSDIVLGCLPLTRWLVQAGVRVTLAANTEPALNDVTAIELETLLRRVAHLDRALAAALDHGMLHVAATGCVTPLIDLTRLTDEFVQTVADADLIILHGMGRAIESNSTARFACDSVRCAVIKDASVAEHMGGKLMDCVIRFEPGT